MSRWVSHTGPERIIAALVVDLERDFGRWEEFARTPRLAAHAPSGVIELMPTHDAEHYAFKYVSGHPGNPRRGLQTVTAFGVLSDVDSGYPIFQSEMTLLTALRTAAVSGLAASYLAPRTVTTAGFIGAGSQSEFHALATALAMRAACGINSIAVYDVDVTASLKMQRNIEPLGFDVTVATTPGEAVRDAQIIITCTAEVPSSRATGRRRSTRRTDVCHRRRLPRQN